LRLYLIFFFGGGWGGGGGGVLQEGKPKGARAACFTPVSWEGEVALSWACSRGGGENGGTRASSAYPQPGARSWGREGGGVLSLLVSKKKRLIRTGSTLEEKKKDKYSGRKRGILFSLQKKEGGCSPVLGERGGVDQRESGIIILADLPIKKRGEEGKGQSSTSPRKGEKKRNMREKTRVHRAHYYQLEERKRGRGSRRSLRNKKLSKGKKENPLLFPRKRERKFGDSSLNLELVVTGRGKKGKLLQGRKGKKKALL